MDEIKATNATFVQLASTISCASINPIILNITRAAMCTHAVSGFNTLWTFQAATGVFLIVALVLFKLVQATFKKHREAEAGAKVVPATDQFDENGMMVAPTPGQPVAAVPMAVPVDGQQVVDPNVQWPETGPVAAPEGTAAVEFTPAAGADGTAAEASVAGEAGQAGDGVAAPAKPGPASASDDSAPEATQAPADSAPQAAQAPVEGSEGE